MKKPHPKKAARAARNLLILCCLALLMSAGLWLPQGLVRWQNRQILGVFHPQPQQQPQSQAGRLSLAEKLSLLSGSIFYNGLQSYFPNPLPYWRDLDYNYASIESDYQLAVEAAADITISPLLTGNRYTPESALSECRGQLDRLTELGLLPLLDTGQPWDTSIQPLLYLSRSAPSHTLIAWQIRLQQQDLQLWATLDDETGLILYLQCVDDGQQQSLAEIETGEEKLGLWAKYWGVTMADCRRYLRANPKDWKEQDFYGFYTAVYQGSGDDRESFLFSAQFTPNFFTLGCLTADFERQDTKITRENDRVYEIITSE